MAYIENPFKVSDWATCINDKFPAVATTNEDKSIIGKQPSRHPQIGQTYFVDEILGEFLRFDSMDNESYNWWKHTHFRKPTTDELIEAIEKAERVKI